MSQPTAYFPTYNFTQFQASHPATPLPAASVDSELFNISVSITEICQNLALIQRDDGALANLSVGNDQLKDEVNLGFNAITNWVTSHAYVVRDYVYQNNNIYRCAIAHTSGVFATDLANGDWTTVVDFNTPVASAAASASAAAASAASAATYAANMAGTSATANTLGVGTLSFSTQSGKFFSPGTPLIISSASSPTTRYMSGVSSSYAGSSLSVAVSVFAGSGSFSDWVIQVAGLPGAMGATGPSGPGSGDMLRASNLSDLVSAATGRSNLGLGNVDNTSDAAKNSAAVTLTNKTMSGAANTITNVSLASGVAGNLPVANLNGGSGASGSTFWRGDGTWGAAVGSVTAGDGLSGGTITSSGTITINTNNSGGIGSYFVGFASGSNIANGNTIAGSNLAYVDIQVSVTNAIRSTNAGLSGTWRNVGGFTANVPSSGASGGIGTWIRVS